MTCLDCVDCLLMIRPLAKDHLKLTDHLRSMVNIDLNNITHWAKQWLVKLNPEKTEIMYFSSRSSPVDLYFSTDDINIKPVDAHKHLGVTLSADRKWSKHINNVVKASRQKIFT